MYAHLQDSQLLHDLNALPHVPAEKSCCCTPQSTEGTQISSLLQNTGNSIQVHLLQTDLRVI